MFMQYDEYELLEIFESEPILISEKEAGMCIYSRSNDSGFKFIAELSVYENACNLSLVHLESIIFEINLTDVKNIKSEGKQLKFFRRDSNRNIIIGFEPKFSVKIENI